MRKTFLKNTRSGIEDPDGMEKEQGGKEKFEGIQIRTNAGSEKYRTFQGRIPPVEELSLRG